MEKEYYKNVIIWKKKKKRRSKTVAVSYKKNYKSFNFNESKWKRKKI
jgi:hypothetical protein